MAEIVPDKNWEATHGVGHEAFFLDVYRLLSHCVASREIAALASPSSRRGLPIGPEKAEISRLLINIASYYRIKGDDGSWMHGEWLDDNYQGVGSLVEDTTAPEKATRLDFREACNKVIHAKKVHFDGGVNESTKRQYVNPIIYLYGDKGGKSWRATLDVVEFCKAAGNVIV
jgi:hypothetical protein